MRRPQGVGVPREVSSWKSNSAVHGGDRVGSCPCARRLAGRSVERPVRQVKQGHLVDALALRGDEGRATLR